MTSPANHQATLEHLAERDGYGFPAGRLFVFEQGVVPALSDNGELLLADRDSLVLAPNGNGGLFAAMQDSGAFAHMREHGIDIISYVQVDNAMAPSADPRFVGYHLLWGSQFSCKAIDKLDPSEAVGSYALLDGHLSIVEYIDIPPRLSAARGPAGRLLFGQANPGLFLWDRAFAEAQATCTDFPVHRAHKKIPCLDADGRPMQPTEPNGFKLELFVLDALPRAQRAIVVACERDAEFAPVKNATGQDSPQTARALLSALHRRWIEAAGGTVALAAQVEISPLYALDEAELRPKLPAGLRIESDRYFGPPAK